MTLIGHNDEVLSVNYSPDGQQILTGIREQISKVLDVETGREILSLSGHDAKLRQQYIVQMVREK